MTPEQGAQYLDRSRMALADIGADPEAFFEVTPAGTVRYDWRVSHETAWRASSLAVVDGNHICWSCREAVGNAARPFLLAARDACLAPAPLMADCGALR